MQTFIRVESKFLVASAHADSLAHSIERHLPVYAYDHGPAAASTFSIYLDSPMLDLYRYRVLDPAHNALLRLRWYGEQPDDHVFTELKVLRGRVLTKRRFRLPLQQLAAFLRGLDGTTHDMRPSNGHARRNDAGLRSELERFIARNGLAPRVQVRYRRQSFQYPDDPSTRVTLDRDVVFSDSSGDRIHRLPFAILEFKFLGHYPRWANAVVDSRYVLECASFSKYEQGCASVFDLRAVGLPTPRWHGISRSLDLEALRPQLTPQLFQVLPRYEYSGDPLAGGRGDRRLSAREAGGVNASDGCGLDFQGLIGHS